jgi:hypothetical protein
LQAFMKKVMNFRLFKFCIEATERTRCIPVQSLAFLFTGIMAVGAFVISKRFRLVVIGQKRESVERMPSNFIAP